MPEKTPEQIERRRARCRTWYYENRDYARECQDQRVARNLAIIDEAKALPCVDCGEQYPPPAMQFDHVRGDKVLPIARMKSYSVERIREELAKCEVRCANCHAVKTWGDSPRYSNTMEKTTT